jgi:hypothetical protein
MVRRTSCRRSFVSYASVRARLAAAGAVLLAGCSGDDASVTRAELPQVVLQPADLTRVWTQFDVGRQIGPDAPPGARADPSRFGRTEGWKARYRRPGSQSTRGPLVIESRADLFEDDDGAERDFELLERDPTEGLGSAAERLEAPSLGDEAVAASFVQGQQRRAVRFYVIAWRHGNVVAALRANGFADSFTLDDVLALAAKQERRLARAAET